MRVDFEREHRRDELPTAFVHFVKFAVRIIQPLLTVWLTSIVEKKDWRFASVFLFEQFGPHNPFAEFIILVQGIHQSPRDEYIPGLVSLCFHVPGVKVYADSFVPVELGRVEDVLPWEGAALFIAYTGAEHEPGRVPQGF